MGGKLVWSRRLTLSVPLVVRGQAADNSAIHEVTCTLFVNPHGGLIALTAKVEMGQSLTLKNKFTQEELECRAVYVGRELHGKREVGFEFAAGSLNFWRVYFPPVGS